MAHARKAERPVPPIFTLPVPAVLAVLAAAARGHSMQTHQISTGRRLSFTVLIAAVLAVTGCTLTTGAPVGRDRAEQAWTDRLDGQAQAASYKSQQEAQLQRANEAYSQRLSGQASVHR